MTFESFRQFLLNLFADRRLLACEKWDDARQRSDQKVSGFKAYLEELETWLPPLPEEFRADIFFAKLKPELKSRLLSTGHVQQQREEILAQAIMQEKILERARAGSGGSHSNSKSSGRTHTRGTLKRTIEGLNPKHKDDVCYLCGKTGHRSPACPDRDKPRVGTVEANSGQAPESPQKRSRRDE